MYYPWNSFPPSNSIIRLFIAACRTTKARILSCGNLSHSALHARSVHSIVWGAFHSLVSIFLEASRLPLLRSFLESSQYTQVPECPPFQASFESTYLRTKERYPTEKYKEEYHTQTRLVRGVKLQVLARMELTKAQEPRTYSVDCRLLPVMPPFWTYSSSNKPPNLHASLATSVPSRPTSFLLLSLEYQTPHDTLPLLLLS
jgi:hypothetical protein